MWNHRQVQSHTYESPTSVTQSMTLILTVVSREEVGPLDVYQWRILIRSSGLAERYNGASCALPLDRTSNVYDQYPMYSCRKYFGPNFSSVLWGWVNSVMRERIFCGVLTVGVVSKLHFKFVSNIKPNKSLPPIESDWLMLLARSVCFFSTLYLEKRGPCINHVKAKDLYSSVTINIYAFM
jgi:hypothetical protein